MGKTLSNRQVRLAARPVGFPKPSDWQFVDAEVRQPTAGEVLVGIEYISLDPAMRGWMNDGKSYVAPVRLGDVMRAYAAGHVLESGDPAFAPGDAVTGVLGVQRFAVVPGKALRRVDTQRAPLARYLAALGMPGMTAYFGLLEIGKPQPGETVVVSAAAGAVGAMVGQIAKLRGCRVVGIAGGPQKCEYLTRELGFAAAVDYKRTELRSAVAAECPDGIDIYFDNVGGEMLDVALENLRLRARVIICGAISQYNNTTRPVGPSNYFSLLVNRALMQGMLVSDYVDRYPDAAKEIAGWLDAGKVKSREDIVVGLEQFPETLLRLFKGENFGKLLLQVSEPL